MNIRTLLFGVPSASRAADVGLLIARLVAGLSLSLAHGIGKVPPSARFIARVGEMGFPAPTLFAWAAGLAELAGLLLALGLLTRPVALFIAIHFAFVILVAHAGDPFGDYEKPLLFATFTLLFAFTGPGRFSLDALLTRRRDIA